MCRSGWRRAGATDGSASRVRSTEDVFPLASPASEPALCVACQELRFNEPLVAVTQSMRLEEGCRLDVRSPNALPSRVVERFRSQGPFQQEVTYGIGAGVLVGIFEALAHGVARGLATGLAFGLVAGLTRSISRYRGTDRKRVTTEQTGIPWLRMLLFSLGFSGLIGAAALATAAVKTERIGILVRGIPAIVPLMLALAAAVFVILATTFWWQDRNK